jgi:hypothetical protein
VSTQQDGAVNSPTGEEIHNTGSWKEVEGFVPCESGVKWTRLAHRAQFVAVQLEVRVNRHTT